MKDKERNYEELYKSAPMTEREKRYLRLLTQQSNNVEALAHFCKYVGWTDTDTSKPKQKPFSYQLQRLKHLASLPNLWNKLK
jgi:hypothetical protein